MRVLIIGMGSIGRRHARLLKEMYNPEIVCLCHRKRTPQEFSAVTEVKECYDKFENSIKTKPDFAIISNPTTFHCDIAQQLAENGIPFLIEKPVSDKMSGLRKLKKTVADNTLPVMVGFQLRQHPGFKKMCQIINSGKIGKPFHLTGYVGQFLPDWRPETDYRNNSSARKELGGGVILDLSHEIDIAISLLGPVERVSCVCGQYSNLEIDTEDVADITLIHKKGCQSQFHLNYLERNYEWYTRICGEKGTVIWDYGKGNIRIDYSDGQTEYWKNPVDFERDTLFRSQLKSWMSVLNDGIEPTVSIEEGIYVTKIINAAKESSMLKRQIAV